MSSRHLRRVLGEPKLEVADVTDESDVEVHPKSKSGFALLLDDDDEEEEEEEDEEQHEESHEEQQEIEEEVEPSESSADEEPSLKKEEMSDEEFEKALEGLKIDQDATEEQDTTVDEQWSRLFTPESARMDPMSELKRKIGSFNAASGEAADARFSHLIDRVKPGRKGVALRKGRNQLVASQPSWPGVPSQAVDLQAALLDEDDEGNQIYVLQHGKNYLNDLLHAVSYMRMGDIEGLVGFVRVQSPYLVDALLVISDYVAMSSVAEASELVEWCLHLIEKAFVGTAFNPFNPAHNLPYSPHPENRKMHLALFRHVQFLIRRGCYRTALEFGKLMIKLDWMDELYVVPLLVQSALMAKQYDWIIEAGDYFQLDPSWQYSIALAHFLNGDRPAADTAIIRAITSDPYGILILLNQDTELGNEFARAAMKIYAARTAALWKDPSASAWLQSHLGAVESSDPSDIWVDDPMHAARFYRHGILSDVPNLNLPLPASLAMREIHSYDPIPPENIRQADWLHGIMSSVRHLFN